MRNIFIENLKMLNDPEYLNLLKENPPQTFKDAIEKKARYLKGQVAKPTVLSIDELGEITSDDDVTLTGLIWHEVNILMTEYPELISAWETRKPKNINKIVEKTFMNFDTIKNSETYLFDELCYQILVSECVRRYFEEIL